MVVDAVLARESLWTAAASLAFAKGVLELGRDLLPSVAMDPWEEKGVAGLRATAILAQQEAEECGEGAKAGKLQLAADAAMAAWCSVRDACERSLRVAEDRQGKHLAEVTGFINACNATFLPEVLQVLKLGVSIEPLDRPGGWADGGDASASPRSLGSAHQSASRCHDGRGNGALCEGIGAIAHDRMPGGTWAMAAHAGSTGGDGTALG